MKMILLQLTANKPQSKPINTQGQLIINMKNTILDNDLKI